MGRPQSSSDYSRCSRSNPNPCHFPGPTNGDTALRCTDVARTLHGRCTCTFLRYSRVSSIYGGARSLIFILNSSTGDRPADHYTVKMAPLTLHSAKHMVSAVSALVYARPFEGKDNRYHISGPALSLFWLHTTPLARRKHQVREVALSRLGLLDRLKTTSATVAREAIADKSVRGV